MEHDDTITADLSRFGSRERGMLENVLRAWREQGLPAGFEQDEISALFNTHSGNVFLTNSGYEVVMLRDDKLEMFYCCPECGNEDFAEAMLAGNRCCRKYVQKRLKGEE